MCSGPACVGGCVVFGCQFFFFRLAHWFLNSPSSSFQAMFVDFFSSVLFVEGNMVLFGR